MSRTIREVRVTDALEARGIDFTVVRHDAVGSLEEAAEAAGVSPAEIVKTLVVRRSDDDFLFVLVPGDQDFIWSKLRELLGVARLSLAQPEVAREITGFAPGTITPFGSTTKWPVIADDLISTRGGDVMIGGGTPGVGIRLAAKDLISALFAQVADVTDPI